MTSLQNLVVEVQASEARDLGISGRAWGLPWPPRCRLGLPLLNPRLRARSCPGPFHSGPWTLTPGAGPWGQGPMYTHICVRDSPRWQLAKCCPTRTQPHLSQGPRNLCPTPSPSSQALGPWVDSGALLRAVTVEGVSLPSLPGRGSVGQLTRMAEKPPFLFTVDTKQPGRGQACQAAWLLVSR